MVTPTTIDFIEPTREDRYKQYILYQLARMQSMFRYEGLPETIPQVDFEQLLQCNGFAGVIEHNGKLYAMGGGLGGQNEYYKPTWLTVTNPALKLSKQYTIDVDVAIVKNDSFYIGVLPMFKRYAGAMADNDITLSIADINARIISIIAADTDGEKKAADKFLSDVKDGKLTAVASNAFTEGIKTLPYAATAAAKITDLIEYQQYLRATWFNEMGLNANYNMKREALNSDEVALNHECLMPLVDDMLRNRQEGVKRVNEMFGTNISVNFNSAWIERGVKNVSLEQRMDGLDNNGDFSDDEPNQPEIVER